MPHRLVSSVIVAMTLATASGCTNNVSLRSGSTGMPLAENEAMAIVGATPNDPAMAVRAQNAVIAALGKRGHVVTPDAAARLEIGITDRLASSGISVIGGQELSAAKRRKFLQSCEDRTYRLVLTHYGATNDVPVSRAWAEEHHCKGTLESSIDGLAEKAVAALVKGSSSEVSERRGKE
jgi:hypothetical protein